ncbi:hypothetical protein AYI68_g5817 [Smittium mucronatum]|uniref:Elongator complex protein 5 n=1 Tax=Smittium mucronatum TaxID=133383 RepID=A0A1R0GT68_9FUNG|nr:hypothetical protein AYI68_g5817 [Smittium mucronatum]
MFAGHNQLVILHHNELSEYRFPLPGSQSVFSNGLSVLSAIEQLSNANIKLYPSSQLILWQMPGWFDQEYTNKFFNSRDPSNTKINPIAKNPGINKSDLVSMKGPISKGESTGLIFLELRKAGGKVSREIVKYTFSNGEFQASFPESFDDPAPEPTNNDPTADIPFNLKLTDDQKQMKDNIVLPYTEAQVETVTTISYQPDTDDDWDEDDPDDDLDF